MSPNGYAYTKTKDGWELTQRLLAEKKLGRKLESHEYVRCNGDKANPKLEDIEICIRGKTSLRRRKLALEARIKDLQDELNYVNKQLSN